METRQKKTRVLIVDDSAVVRQLLTEILANDPAIEVVGVAQDPYIAREKIKQLNPDVLTLDVEMPRMDGITFLRNLMRLRPMPVVMISSFTARGADTTLEALEIGAVDFVSKPKADVQGGLEDYAEEIRGKVKAAARVRLLDRHAPSQGLQAKLHSSAGTIAPVGGERRHSKTTDRIVVIGASTGGTEAIKEILIRMPANAPGIVISQHIPEAFSAPFAARMDKVSAMTVREAQDGQPIQPGHVYIAPGNRHLLVERDGARFRCALSDGPPVNRHRPSVDLLFRSVAENAGAKAIGVILTGMGSDGAQGMKEMRDMGATTIAQDKNTSTIWGMPGEAVNLDAAQAVLPLDVIAGHILMLAGKDENNIETLVGKAGSAVDKG